jgi:hypothetical protein
MPCFALPLFFLVHSPRLRRVFSEQKSVKSQHVIIYLETQDVTDVFIMRF